MRANLMVIAIALVASFAYASPDYLVDVETAYPAAVGSRIDACLICHVNADPNTQGTARNSYGTAYRTAGHSVTAIESADSDGDGFSNLAEITAKTFPGNAADFPAPATGSLTVTILPAGAIAAGAQWRVGTGAYQNSGATVPGLAAGSVNLNFKPIVGWTTPADQSPTIAAGGTANASGTYVQLALVPNVVGQTQSAASTAITGAGLTVGLITQEFSATVPSGTVLGQGQGAGTYVALGTAVALTVSKGPQPVPVPNVVGQTQAAASTLILGAGLVVGTITQEFSATVPVGIVIGQIPTAGGAPVAPGTAVQLTVSKGAQPVITGSIIINRGAWATNSTSVSLSLTWSANAVRMRFSDNGANWTPWESLKATRVYALPVGTDGYRTVRVQFLDIADNRSIAYNDYIILDRVLPTGSIAINSGAQTTASLSVTLNLSSLDPGSGVQSMRFSNDGANWTPWEAAAATRAYALPGPAGYNTVRVQYRDAAGNYSAIYSDYIFLQAI